MLKRPRKLFIPGNKYQTKVIFLAFFPTLLICLFLDLLIALAEKGYLDLLSRWSWGIAAVLSGIFVYALIRVFFVSSHLVGPFDRIIKELDTVIANNSARAITARPGDELANELLKRINILIQKR